MIRLAFIINAFICFNSVAQNQLIGVFEEERAPIAESELRYRFFEDGAFVYQYWDDVGDYFGFGSYDLDSHYINFNYIDIPEFAKSIKIISAENNDTCSMLHVLNPLMPGVLWNVSYQITNKDSIIKTGKADELGFVYFNLDSNQNITVYAHSENNPASFVSYAQFSIKASDQPKDFVVYANGLMKSTSFIQHKIESYPIKINRKGDTFKIKINEEWTWYNQIDI